MARKTIDCRMLPSEKNCTVTISGEEDEVLELAAAHAVSTHGHTDDDSLRDGLRASMRDEEELLLAEGAFLQLIEFHAGDPDRFMALADEWRDRIGADVTARWAVVGTDRDRPDTYVEVVAFPDFDSAMRNSEHPATAEFAKKLQDVTDGEPSFRNLDVRALLRL
jgi:predicted small metal-binding protein